MKQTRTDILLAHIRNQEPLSKSQQAELVVRLSMPSMIAQFFTIAMDYIDAAMVGHLGDIAEASIGLVSTTIWLLCGLIMATAIGFTVPVAHRIGINELKEARSIMRQGITTVLIVSIIIGSIALAISPFLPHWLGGSDEICSGATIYLSNIALAMPFVQMRQFASGMLCSSGKIKLASMLNALACVFDVTFNSLFIFQSRNIDILGTSIFIPGAGLGIRGAAQGTLLSEAVISALMLYFLCFRSPLLRIDNEKGSFRPTLTTLKKAFRISAPITLEYVIMCSAQITVTAIVAPLGAIALAAHAFGITIEELCYMPGYGLRDAATTLIGQSIGAKRRDLAINFGYMTVATGIIAMTTLGTLMYIFAEDAYALLTPMHEIIQQGSEVLRIEAFAEPMYAASIVCYGVMVGAGNSLIPCSINFTSIWVVRIILALLLVPHLGLVGVWLAMAIELTVRGLIMLCCLFSKVWIKIPE